MAIGIKNYFKTWELVPWDVWLLLGENARNLVSKTIVRMANLLREEGGLPMTCNTKGKGGRDASGLRVCASSHYKKGSQHSGNHGEEHVGDECNALDLVTKCDVKQYHVYIITNRDKYKDITFLEIDISWLHMDGRSVARMDTGKLELWSPSRGFVSIDKYIQELREDGFLID